MKKTLTLLAAAFLVNLAAGQTTVIDRNVEKERIEVEEESGNQYFHFGSNISIDADTSLTAKSNSGSIGYGYSGKVISSRFFSLLGEGYYEFDNYKLVQSASNALNFGQEYEKQNIRVHSFRIGLRGRIHLTKHGYRDGTYLEFGAAGAWNFGRKMTIKQKLDPSVTGSQAAEEVELAYRKLGFIEKLGYEVNAGIGRNGLTLFGRYRLSNLFKPQDSVNNGLPLPEIAPLMIGLKFDLPVEP